MSPDAGGHAALEYWCEASPAQASVTPVAPGLRWLVMPLPMSLNHINLWLLDDTGGTAIVDTGIASEKSREVWRHVFDGPLKGEKITRLIITHAHPDHIGLAGWLAETLGIEVWISKTEWEMGYRMSRDPGPLLEESGMALFTRGGLAPEAIKLAGGRINTRLPVAVLPEHFHRLEDGMTLKVGGRDWRIVVGRGHAPEHCSLWAADGDLFIAGDQVLPKITPNVSLWPSRVEQDPLGAFLASADTIEATVPDSVLVLPSHNLPFHRLHNRLQQLRDHHADRLDEVVEACDTPKTAVELVPVLFKRKLDQRQMGFAMGEALAHLQHAANTGRLTREERGDGGWIFERS